MMDTTQIYKNANNALQLAKPALVLQLVLA